VSPAHSISIRALLLCAIAACGGQEKAADTQAVAATPAPVAAASGEELFQRCITCHQVNGQGIPGTYPPLAGSEYATAKNPAVPINILIHGIQGPLTVKGTTVNGLMPPYGVGVEMSDDEVAAVLTYVRQAWGNNASPITAQQVAQVRAAARQRTGPVTAEELKPLM
jgi:mono/diheme cytochrome c family protein